MDSSLEIELDKARGMLDRVSWPLAVMGMWPKNVTALQKIRFTLFTMYFCTHLSMQYMDLATVLSSLELVIMNLMESSFQTMFLFRMLTVRFNKLTQCIIEEIEKNLIVDNFRNAEEVRLYAQHTATADRFYRLAFFLSAMTAFLWYIQPLQIYFITRMLSNETAILVNPYRIYTFIDITPIERTSIVYFCQFPMMYTGVAYTACLCIMLGFVTNFCGQLAVLSYRVSNLTENEYDHRIFFRQHTEQHLKVVAMAQWLNDAFHLPLFFDLMATTVLMGLIAYKFLLNIDQIGVFGVVGLLSYIITMTILVYVNCFMGEYLNTECTALLNAYYQCNWYEMPMYCQRALIICMKTTQEPLRLTAGKYYTFSLEGFAQIMKSSVVYVQMLRAVN